MKKSKTILVTAAFWLCAAGYGQGNISLTLPDIVPVSPEAAAIAKYVNYPVDHTTGLVKIEIPLYEVKCGDMTLPITLSYHASGLKVNENSGIVGSGWTLNAEPSITRSIQGYSSADYGDYPSGDLNCNFTNEQLKHMADYAINGGPDLFYYKLSGRSGSFHFRKTCGSNTSQIVTVPYEPLRIQYPSTERFVITEENGVRYEFGGGPAYTEYTTTTLGQSNTTQFKAAGMQSASTGGRISFTYKSAQESHLNLVDGIIVTDQNTCYYSDEDPEAGYVGINGLISFPHVAVSIGRVGMIEPERKFYELDSGNRLTDEGYIPEMPYVTGRKSASIDRRLIEKIVFDGGRVLFSYASDRLIRIDIADGDNRIFRTISFLQSPFNGHSEKYKLDELTIRDKNNYPVETYQFGYRNTDMVPSKTSKNIDHWGYSNSAPISGWSGNTQIDASNSMCAIPRHRISLVKYTGETVQADIGEADREPSEEYMGAGMLSAIYYPTGACKRFFYEGNYFDKSGICGLAGGLRIERIEDEDPFTGQTLVTSYRYGLNESGVGYINHIPSMEDYMVESRRRYRNSYTVRIRTYSSWSIPDLFRAGGPPVVYRYVAEYKETATKLLRTTWQYEAYNDTWWGRDVTSPFSHHYNDWWRLGHLKEKAVFDSETQTFVETYNCSYQSYRQNASDTRIFRAYYGEEYRYSAVHPEMPNNPPDTPPIALFRDIILSGCIRKVSETVTKDGVTARTDYQYGNLTHLFPTRITQTNSNGISTVENFTYPQDNISLTGDALTAKNELVSQWQINALLRHETVQGSRKQTVQADYKIVGNRVKPAVIKTFTDNDAPENRTLYRHYSDYGHPVGISCEGGPATVYLWGYQHQYPIAKIENASYEEVTGLMGGESAVGTIAGKAIPSVADFTKVNSLRTLLPGAMVTVYGYSPLVGVTSVTDPSGRTVYYDRDSYGRLSQIRDDTDILQLFDYQLFQFP
ncbi:MAG: hypothetical protein LBL04_06170 [Bacteroidales bacterium]|jgi:YD repeat-containing protein|nr:hypothetical protein [Bacteroidales bacterium]